MNSLPVIATTNPSTPTNWESIPTKTSIKKNANAQKAENKMRNVRYIYKKKYEKKNHQIFPKVLIDRKHFWSPE